MLVLAAVCAAAVLVVLNTLPAAVAQLPGTRAQEDCVCSKGVNLIAGKDQIVHAWNCMCGGLQCIVAARAEQQAAPALSCR
jgi:hypothetical protein